MTYTETSIRSLIFTGIGLMLISSQLLMNSETISANSKNQKPSSWQIITTKIFRRKPRQPISRGDLCLISPTNQKAIYSTRPLFLWKGNFKKIAVANLGSNNPFWEYKISEQKSFVSYTGKDKLQPGETYEWHGYIGENPAILAEFNIMDTQQQQVVSDELKKLERQLLAKGANKEIIARYKVEYFIDKELWSNALQEAYAVPNPSPELSQILQDLPDRLCK
jgi:hypothetical protein